MAASRNDEHEHDDEESRARITKYEAWLATLERVRADYAARQLLYTRFFVLVTAASLLGFVRSAFTGLWAFISTFVVSVAGHYMVKTRLWELSDEIEQTRGEIQRLRGGPPG